MHISKMVEQVALGRNVKAHFGSIAFNESAKVLRQTGVSSVDAIERFVERLSARRKPVGAKEFDGLPSLFGIYLSMVDSCPSADTFLISLKPILREQAMRAVLFRWGPAGRNALPSPPVQIINFVTQLRDVGNETERDLAGKLLSHLFAVRPRSGKRKAAKIA